jgi:nitrogen fixation/metabolism regulation signal transduction histidine kinase
LREWVVVNLFFFGMAATAAGLLVAFRASIRAFGFAHATEDVLIGCSAVLTLMLTYLIWRSIYRIASRRK